MSTKFKTVITTAGAAKLAAATVPGGKKINLNVMAVGDGGGKLPVPDAGQTQLVNEVWRHTLNKISQDNRYSNYIVAELVIPPEVGGFWMRELGLYDDEGTLIAVANMAESYKPELAEGSGRAQTCRMVIIVSSVESVALSIDSTMVMATQDYVDDRLAAHEKSRRHPDATLKEKGFTQLSNATDSESETLAATPKAVKTAYDLANGKYTAQDASTTQKGIVQLSSSTGNDNENQAATSRAVKIAMDNANARLAKERNGGDIPAPALFRQNIGVYDASTSQKGLVRLNGGVTDESNETAATSGAVKVAYDAAIAAADIAKTKWSAVDATISQKGIVMLSDNTGVPDSTTAATTTAVNYVLNQAAAAYSLAESKYTAGGATTGKAGLVQLVNSMGGSGLLVMPQAAVTTAIQNYPSLGKGQNLQDLRGSRSIDATYTNSTGFPIAVYVRIAGGTSANLYAHVNGIEFGGGGSIASNTSIATAFFIVPNGATYRVMASGSSIALQAWSELR